MSEQLKIARALKAQGISTIPVSHLKIPLLPWKRYQSELPTDADLERWFADGKSMIGLVSGAVMCIDFDEKYAVGILARFAKRAEEVGLDYLLGDLLRQRTKNNGFHLVFRCDGQRIGNEKLASRPPTEAELAANDQVTEFVMIETRGDGGYFVIAPSAGYELEQGDWTAIPLISEDDRDALINLARTFNEITPREIEVPDVAAKPPSGFEISPGDDYDQRADLPSLLKRHGWKPARNDNRFWTRPGKDSGISASWNQVPGRFFVFSTSTKFEAGRVYKPWHVYAILECGGDFSAAARELQRQGFGRRALRVTSTMIADPTPTPEGKDPLQAAPTTETEVDRMRRLWRARTFDPTKEPPPTRTTFELGGVTISTPGNLMAITAQAKTGKSSLVCAMIAAAMIDDYSEADTLTARGFNRDGKALIFIDTEQSPDDFWHQVNRAKKRARLDELPGWIHAANVADLPASTCRRVLGVVLADFAQAHGGIHCVIIDGIADLVADVNDSEECNQLVAELHALAIRYDCSIICVIHKNPGTDKVRGHLGSQIERKAETNLSLDKEDEVTVVWSAKQRRQPILKKNGPRFRWSDDMKMHVTVSTVASEDRKTLEYRELAESVLQPGEKKEWRALHLAITEARSTPNHIPVRGTVGKWITEMQRRGVISREFGAYSLSKSPSDGDFGTH
jgi:hypothetical protein